MDAMRAWADFEFAGAPKTIRSYFQNSGIYIFLISFGCVYYLSNAELLLGHYDLGWHLAAGDLLRDRGNIPFQDPWSFTVGDRQWFNLSWLWDVIASALYQYTNFSGLVLFVVGCGAVIIGYLASICLDLSPEVHPAMGRILWSFEPVWLGDATGRGAEPSTQRSVPSRCIADAVSLA